jgi:response regulator RpfG family c-di-GMP phosphodiesterase
MDSTPDEESARKPAQTALDDARKTIVIYSPDLNFCFSLSMVFQDRYNVVTTTNLTTLEKSVAHYSADLLVVDADPSEKIIQRIDRLRESNRRIPVILLYVFNSREGTLDRAVRSHVDSVFYKPVEISAVSRRIDELLTA